MSPMFFVFRFFMTSWMFPSRDSFFCQIVQAGGQCTTDRHCPTKTLSARGDMESDQLHVPAIFHLPFSEDGNRLSQEPAWRFNLFSGTVSAICILFSLFGTYFISIDNFCTQSELRFKLAHSGIWQFCINLEAGISSLRGTWASAAWVLSISC